MDRQLRSPNRVTQVGCVWKGCTYGNEGVVRATPVGCV